MNKAEERAFEVYPKMSRITEPHGIIPADYKSHYIGDANEEKRMGFIEGYHQAEKDLDISWVKEVSGVKEMKRAKEEALKAYPPISIAANYDTINRRNAFEFGYLKAEKDLELTWEDMMAIDDLLDELLPPKRSSDELVLKGYYEEVLKRFLKERKEK